MSRLQTVLRNAGYPGDRDQFRNQLADLFAENYRDWTDEKLLFHPDEAKRYCNLIRAKAGANLPDDVILAALCGIRKHK